MYWLIVIYLFKTTIVKLIKIRFGILSEDFWAAFMEQGRCASASYATQQPKCVDLHNTRTQREDLTIKRYVKWYIQH